MHVRHSLGISISATLLEHSFELSREFSNAAVRYHFSPVRYNFLSQLVRSLGILCQRHLIATSLALSTALAARKCSCYYTSYCRSTRKPASVGLWLTRRNANDPGLKNAASCCKSRTSLSRGIEMKTKNAKKAKENATIQVVDKRRAVTAVEPETRRSTPPGRRDHAILLGCYDRNSARKFLEGKGLEESLIEELLKKRVAAEDRMKSRPPLDEKT